MLSICLQSMVDELMVKKSGGSIRKVRLGLLIPLVMARSNLFPDHVQKQYVRMGASKHLGTLFFHRCSADEPLEPYSVQTVSKQ